MLSEASKVALRLLRCALLGACCTAAGLLRVLMIEATSSTKLNLLLFASHLCLQVFQLLLFLSSWDLHFSDTILVHGAQGTQPRRNQVCRLPFGRYFRISRRVSLLLEFSGKTAAQEAKDRAIDHSSFLQTKVQIFG